MRKLALLLSLVLAAIASAEERWIVEYRSARPSVQRLREDIAGARVVREFGRVLRGVAIVLPSGTDVNALRRLPYVAAVHRDQKATAFATPSHGAVGSQPTGSGGEGIVVAVIDSGIDYTHPALAASYKGGYDFVNDDSDPMDDSGHGTVVAGVIAANSAEVTGVAPEVSLLAYKVLGADGSGYYSDILAAIERMVDPNGDGDSSDHVDVANISLGGFGSPDDILSRGVDAASAAGVVVCVAAGNWGSPHSISSPALAPSAIAVGALDTHDSVAYFSAMGPAPRSLAIKPEILARGVDVRTTTRGGDFGTSSGTSLSAPYVTGVAALLREAHPEWTPSQVKSAIVNSARWLDGTEPMAQGGGVVDLASATASDIFFSPSTLSFGIVSASPMTRTVRVTNRSAADRAFTATIDGASAGITVSVSPDQGTIPAGQSIDLVVTLSVDLEKHPYTRGTFSFGGRLTVESSGVSRTVPWAVVDAARATATYDREEWRSEWLPHDDRQWRYHSVPIDPFVTETLMERGTYDQVVFSFRDGDVRVHVGEQLNLSGDMIFPRIAADAAHAVTLAATDETGTPFPEVISADRLYRRNLRLILPKEAPFEGIQTSIELPAMKGKTLHVSTLSSRYALMATENFIDLPAHRIYVAQHPLARAIATDIELRTGPADLKYTPLRVHFPAGATERYLVIVPGMLAAPSQSLCSPQFCGRHYEDFRPLPPGTDFTPRSLVLPDPPLDWTATLFMTREADADFGNALELDAYFVGREMTPEELYFGTDGLHSGMIRRRESFFVTGAFHPSLFASEVQEGDVLAFGSGPVWPSGTFTAHPSGSGPFSWVGQIGFRGDRNEWRRAEADATTFRIVDASGAVVVPDERPGLITTVKVLPVVGRYRAEFRTSRTEVAGLNGEAALDLDFDSRRADSSPPELRSLAILDGAGRHNASVPPRSAASLVFSATDYNYGVAYGTYQRPAEGETRVSFRRRGTQAWTPLSVVETADQNSIVFYRVDLSAATAELGTIDLRIEVTDPGANKTTWSLMPAFRVSEPIIKRRTVRH